MKFHVWPGLCGLGLILTGCHSTQEKSDVVSQQFIHKYGFGMTEQEWEERAQDGQVITHMKDGVTVQRSYENGQLHGVTTFTFPNSTVIQKMSTYDQGSLLKEVFNDQNGVPIYENVYEFDDRRITTNWDEHGSPLCVEEFTGDSIVEGKYYTPDHDLESQVVNGSGIRIKRDRSGLILFKDRIDNGVVCERTNFHPNGQIQGISRYENFELHGEQVKNTPSGKPLMVLHWNHGILDGVKTVYRNGMKIAEIPYVNGQKHGMELHFDDLGALTAEIPWRNDKKHGACQFHTEENTEKEWFFRGHVVNEEKFHVLQQREQMIADMNKDMKPSNPDTVSDLK